MKCYIGYFTYHQELIKPKVIFQWAVVEAATREETTKEAPTATTTATNNGNDLDDDKKVDNAAVVPLMAHDNDNRIRLRVNVHVRVHVARVVNALLVERDKMVHSNHQDL